MVRRGYKVNRCANPKLFETGLDENERMQLFFYEPRRSDQKGSLERNHEFIRYSIPKGTSIDGLDERATIKVMNHINSARRKNQDKKKLIEQIREMLVENIIKELGIEEVPQDKVVLRPRLIK